jgi:predicted TIM-barrel fold metal-dependent hydrolase
LPTQRYAIDERVKRATAPADVKRRPSLWAKIGGALAPSELRPGRPGLRESMVREYANVRKYQDDVARLVRAGWEIDQQVDRPEKIVVRWFREPSAEGPS